MWGFEVNVLGIGRAKTCWKVLVSAIEIYNEAVQDTLRGERMR